MGLALDNVEKKLRMERLLITTVPFVAHYSFSLALLDSIDVDFEINTIGRRLKEDEVVEMVTEKEIRIAGTGPITAKVVDAAPNLKLISRVRIGLGNVDLLAAQTCVIAVSCTPGAHSPAMAELTFVLMLWLPRHTHVMNVGKCMGEWDRPMGRRISEVTIGSLEPVALALGYFVEFQFSAPQEPLLMT